MSCGLNKTLETKDNLCATCWSSKYSDLTALRKKYEEMDLTRKLTETKSEWIERLKNISRTTLRKTIYSKQVNKNRG